MWYMCQLKLSLTQVYSHIHILTLVRNCSRSLIHFAHSSLLLLRFIVIRFGHSKSVISLVEYFAIVLRIIWLSIHTERETHNWEVPLVHGFQLRNYYFIWPNNLNCLTVWEIYVLPGHWKNASRCVSTTFSHFRIRIAPSHHHHTNERVRTHTHTPYQTAGFCVCLFGTV